ncbi:unnamed protein product [Prunus armeniaca]
MEAYMYVSIAVGMNSNSPSEVAGSSHIAVRFLIRSFWSEHSSILEQRLELETGDHDRCAVLLVLKSLSTVEIGVEEEEKCVGLTSRETGVGNDSRALYIVFVKFIIGHKHELHHFVTPEVRSELKPKLGLEFDCYDNVFNFYNMYAAEARFGIRCSTTRMCTLTGEVTRKEYVCCKQGYALTSTVSRKRRRRGCTRTGCKAKLAILKVKDKNKYIVVGFNEVHNHDMTTVDKVHLLRSHRNLTESTKVYSADMSKVNIPVYKQLSLLEVQVGELENVGFVNRDVYNYLRDVRGEVIGHDAELLKEHFMAMQEKNESFYFKMEVDSEGRMGNVFWSDARSRRAYGFFGHVVVFDTTFNTNRYRMVFAPLLGVNNHRQTVLFGCAFLTSETTDSFVWLLEEFKKAMLGEPPKMIITDQDAAMSKAIAQLDLSYGLPPGLAWPYQENPLIAQIAGQKGGALPIQEQEGPVWLEDPAPVQVQQNHPEPPPISQPVAPRDQPLALLHDAPFCVALQT